MVFQGDAGTAVVMAGIVVGMLWIVGTPWQVLAGLGAAGIAGVAAMFVTSSVRMRRLAAFLDPSINAGGINDQANAGMYAIASGGWWGVGLGASRQKWGSLPEAHTDFIFAVLGEEFGLLGSLVVLALFGVLGYAGVRIAARSDDPFARYAAGGVTVVVHGPGAVQPRCGAAAATGGRRPAADGVLWRLGPGGEPARRGCAAGLRPTRARRTPDAGAAVGTAGAADDDSHRVAHRLARTRR